MDKPKYNFKQTVKSTSCLLKMVCGKKQGKRLIAHSGVFSCLNALVPIGLSVLPGMIINELTGDRRLQVIGALLATMLFIPVVYQLFSIMMNRRIMRLSFELKDSLETDFYIHLSQVDFEYRESPDIGMMGGRAKDTIQNSANIISQLFGLMSSVVSVIALFSIISTLSPIVIVVIVLIMYINSLIAKRLNADIFKLNKESDRLSRFLLVSHNPLAQYLWAKEMRIFGLTPYMIDKKTSAERDYFNNELSKNKLQSKAGVKQSLLGCAQQLIIYAYLIYKVLAVDLPIGTMSIYLSAAGQFSSAVGGVFGSYLGLNNNVPHVNEMIEYMNLPLTRSRCGNEAASFGADSVIEFKNVSFRYPGSDRDILKNFNLKIRSGETLCIVGENGAGKSTFIKLLCRMFSPTDGEILLNGKSLNEYEPEQYIKMFAAVFQDYQLFDGLTLGENIVLTNDYDAEKLDAVCKSSGIYQLIEKLPRRYDTYISKWLDEDGITPSGGEEQRIAIARACYRGGSIYLLDEPTAALDPLAEYEIYTQFHNMIHGRTAVMITHRLSAVQLADKVAVFNDGHVAEYGTHAELYAKGGIYTEMFDKQARFYRDKPSESDGDEECE